MIDSKNKLRFYIAADRIMAGYSPFPDIKTKIKELIFPNPIITYLKSMRYVSYYTNKLHTRSKQFGINLNFID